MSSPTNWGALLKKTYGSPVDPIPSDGTIAADIDFIPQDKRPGDKYTFPVRLQHEGGATYNNDHTAFPLGSAIDSKELPAELEGSEIAVYGDIPVGMMTKMNASKGESGRAYDQAMGRKLVYLMEAAELRRELALMYGSGTSGLSNLGVVNTTPAPSVSGSDVTVGITRDSFIGGLWPQLIGFKFEVHDNTGVVHAASGLTLKSVNKTNTRLTFTAATAGEAGQVVAGDQIRFFGSRITSCIGLEAILANTGTLFGISAATYPQWKAETYSVGNAPLTFDKVIEGLTGSSENGASDGVNLYVSGRQWTDLMTDEAALVRRLKDDQKTYKRGAGSIEFESLVGPIKIKVHRYMKQGTAWAIPVKDAARVGSTDITFRAPGSKNEWFYREMDQKMGCQVRCYSDQGIIVEKPYHCTLFTGIQSVSDVLPS